jgi:hypothetical protein
MKTGLKRFSVVLGQECTQVSRQAFAESGITPEGLEEGRLSETYSSATFIPTGGTTSTIVTSTSHPHSSGFLVFLGVVLVC